MGAALEVQELGHEPVPIWGAGMADSGFTYYTSMLSAFFTLLILSCVNFGTEYELL